MVQISLAEMFSSLGWGSGFKLPVSSEVNARLERELEQKQRKALQLSSELEEHNHYVGILSSQIDRVTEQIDLDQKIVVAKKSELETEVSLKGISIRTLSKAHEDCKRLQKQVNEINSRNIAASNDLRKRQSLIDELVGIVQFDKNALERYRESIEEKENYIAFVEQFAEMDKKAIEECKKKYDKVAAASTDANHELIRNYQLTIALQSQLDQNTSLLRRTNQERVEALSLWKSTLSSMKLRDAEMSEIAKVYADARCAVKGVEEKVNRKREMLESEHHGTQQAMRLRSKYDRSYADLKQKLNAMIEETIHMNELQSHIKGEIKKFSHDTKTVMKKIGSLEEEIKSSKAKLHNLESEVAHLKGREEMVMGDAMTSEERMKEIEALLDSETNNIETLIGHLERERSFLWNRNSQKMELTNKLEQLEFGIRTRKAHIVAMKDTMLKQEERLRRKKVLLYEVEVEVFQLSNRCETLLNPIATIQTEEIIEKQRKIKSLKDAEDKVENQKTYLTQEVKHIDDIVRKITKQLQLAIQDHQYLKGNAVQDRIEIEKYKADLKTKIKNAKDETVEYRLTQVQLKRLNDLVKAQRNTLFDLEHSRLLMNSVAKEKKSEIDVHLSLLNGKKRMVLEDRSKIKMEIADVYCTAEKLKKKYDIIMHTLNSEPGDNEVHSEAYYIVKQAEEAELLKQEGDLWDARVKEAEQEIIAIQNTLSLIFNSNNSFKESLAPIVESSPESVAIKKLNEDSEMALVSKKHSNKERAHLAHQMHLTQEEIRSVTDEIIQLNVECYDRKYELSAMHLDLENQNTKIRRANIMSNKILKELGPQSEHERNFIELDMKYLATKTKLEYALSTMERFVSMYPTIKTTVVEYLHMRDMKKAAARIMNSGKSGASSAVSTPNRSGRTTPISGKSLHQKLKTLLPPPKSATETSSNIQDETTNKIQSYNNFTDANASKAVSSTLSAFTEHQGDVDLQDSSVQMSTEEVNQDDKIAISSDLPEEFVVPTNEEATENENEEDAVVLLDRHSLREADSYRSVVDEELEHLGPNIEE